MQHDEVRWEGGSRRPAPARAPCLTAPAPAALQVIWQVIMHGHCSFRAKTKTQNFCRNEYNVTGAAAAAAAAPPACDCWCLRPTCCAPGCFRRPESNVIA